MAEDKVVKDKMAKEEGAGAYMEQRMAAHQKLLRNMEKSEAKKAAAQE